MDTQEAVYMAVNEAKEFIEVNRNADRDDRRDGENGGRGDSDN